MKRSILLASVVLLGVASVVRSERKKVDAPASPAAFLYLVADTEQELTRMPANFARMSDEEEIRIGNQLARSYAATDEQKDAQETVILQHYVTRVGTELATRAHRKLPYKFHYLPDSNLINAFALPGGHVYIGGGLMALMDTEDELAAVLGHEIEHIDHYHCAERVQQQEALRRIPLGELVELPLEVFTAGYSKDQELEADREGTRLAVQTGYSPDGAIHMFEVFERLQKEDQAKPGTPQEEASRVVEQALEGYFRSHPLPAERIAQVRKLIASEGWTVGPERELRVAYLFRTERARNALNTGKYAQAEQVATQSLKLRPDQPQAFHVLGLAQFAQANFSGAAASYRKILEIEPSNSEAVTAYAQALAAADAKGAAAEFRRWTESTTGEKSRAVSVAAAGLNLLAGEPGAADRLEGELRQSGEAQAPIWIGELGWWRYLQGDYPAAVDRLSEARQQRPGDGNLWLRLAWALIEVRRYSDALQMLEGVAEEGNTPPAREILRAVAHWEAQQREQALRDFDVAVNRESEWENPNWVRALYSPGVARSVQEMRTERERQKKEAAAHKKS